MKFWEVSNNHISCGIEEDANLISLAFMEKIALNEPVELQFEDNNGDVSEDPDTKKLSTELYIKLSEFHHLTKIN